MPLAALAVAIASLISAPGWGRAAARVRHQTEAGSWRLETTRDRFSGETVCRLRERHGHAFYQGRAVGFRFGRDRDVAAATYRIDNGPLRRWRDDMPELVTLGTPLDTGAMTNPTDGVVWVPWRLLTAANNVAIQPAPGRRVRIFHLNGVRGLRLLGATRGCATDARFVR